MSGVLMQLVIELVDVAGLRDCSCSVIQFTVKD